MKFLMRSLLLLVTLINFASAEEPPDSSSNVMFIHASPDAPSVDIQGSNKEIDKQIQYSQTTGYQKIEPGLHEIDVRVADKDSTLVPAQLQFQPDTSYSVFYVDSAKKAELLVVTDHLHAPPAGKALIRFVNLVPDSPELDLTHDNGHVIMPDRGFKEYTDFKAIDAGTHQFQLQVAGTDSVLIKFPEVLLLSGQVYTFLAHGFVAGKGAQGLKVEMIENK